MCGVCVWCMCLRRGCVWGVSEEGDVCGVCLRRGCVCSVSKEGMCVGCV